MSARVAPLRLFALALAARSAVVMWAMHRIPPAEDGHFYHVVAARIARGLGYTWLWPDGTVTYAAHYPVGYPALIGLGYALFGASPIVAMLINALLGSLAAVAAFFVMRSVASDSVAGAAGLLVALHPALVAYTPALMTEGVTAALLMLAAWAAVSARAVTSGRRGARLAVLGGVLGVTALMRPQCLALTPLYAIAAIPGTSARPWRKRLVTAAVVGGLTVGLCVPWTLRNCERMGRCVFVSANGGWNLLIGTAPDGNGTWVPMEQVGVPAGCRTEFREAFKDSCFGAAAVERIRAAPLSWLRLVPAKLRTTFDYSGAPGWYLHSSNPEAFGFRAKVVLGAVETLSERALLAAALWAVACRSGRFERLRRSLAVVAAVSLLSPFAWPAYLALPVLALLWGSPALDDPPVLLAAGAIFATALTHAVFFGAGRYSMPCFPLIAAVSASTLAAGFGRRQKAALGRERSPFDSAPRSG